MSDIKVFLYGLDHAGKTAITETIKREKMYEETKPTLALIISKTLIKNTKFIIWDLPGQILFRDSWKNKLLKSKLLIFILDTSDIERFDEAKNEFQKILNDPDAKGVPLIFCFHKMDLINAKNNLIEAQNRFRLESIDNRKVVIQETSIKLMESIKKLEDSMVKSILG